MGVLIPTWSEDQRSQFLKQPVAFNHQLLNTGMFTDEALAYLLETHPDERTDVNINDIYDDGTCRVRTGTRGGLSGEQMLERIREGRLWINLRQIDLREADGRNVVERFFGELSALNANFRPFGLRPHLLISAPQARVPYHADTPGVVLAHLVGRKRIWIYPNHGKFLRDEAMERVALRETTEDLPYDPAWDAEAICFDLEPGQALVWPYNAPHRVDNQGTFNVSLSCEFSSWEVRLRHGAYYTNGTLRRRFGLSPKPIAEIGTMGRAARWAASTVLKALKVNRAAEARFETEFDVARDTAAYRGSPT